MSTVACADCGTSVLAEQADLSANGWRCRACSLRHQIDVHQGADDQIGELSIDEMDQRASKAMSFVVLSILGGLVCLVLLATGAIAGETRAAARARIGVALAIPTSIAVAGYELIAWRRAKRAAAVMRSREPG